MYENRINRNMLQYRHNLKTIRYCIVYVQGHGYTAKKCRPRVGLLFGFNCYSTLRRWMQGRNHNFAKEGWAWKWKKIM